MLKITTSPRLLFLMVCAKVFTSCATPMVEEAQEGLTTEYGLDGYNADEVVIPLWVGWPGEGAPVRGAGNIQDKPHSLTTRWVIDNDSPRASLEFSLTRMILPNLSAGIEFMPEYDRYSPVVNWRFIEAAGWRPAVTVGTSSAWPSSKVNGNAYILSVGNSIAKGLSAYVAASYAPSGDLWQIPAGLNYRINKDWSSRLMYDGDKLHPIITHSYGDIRTSFILLDSKSPTLSVSFSF